MQPLNPFVKAFFSSKLPAQCSPPSNYILFFPTTEHLLTHKEHETQTDWEELVNSEEIISSHVVRVSSEFGSGPLGKDGSSLRDGKGKAKQFATLNSKTVVVKDNFVYSNKGFKSLNQAQLLHDSIYWPELPQAQPWLIHYISKPLVGTPEPLYPKLNGPPLPSKSADQGQSAERPDIKGFKDVLDHYPIIARQMQPGLDQLFQQFTKTAELSASATPPPVSPASSHSRRPRLRRSIGSFSSSTTLDGAQSLKSRSSIREDEPAAEHLRQALENMVASAIEIFQGVDKNQLSFLGTSTNLSEPAVELMIERYVTEYFHDKILFPKLCQMRESEDSSLDGYIRQMADVDLVQAGAELEEGHEHERELSRRLQKGVEAFRKIGTASSPQEMMEILLETEKSCMTDSAANPSRSAREEKVTTVITTNADLLVSMLMLVVIRSSVRHLNARLLYMVEFTFIEEVETGEVGYALSTFEAVLSFLSNNPSGLRKASRANRAFWRAIKRGDVSAVREMLENESALEYETSSPAIGLDGHSNNDNVLAWVNTNGAAESPADHKPAHQILPPVGTPVGLAHVSPFETTTAGAEEQPRKAKKRVSMDTQSVSSSSATSHVSHASTAVSTMSARVETTPAKLCRAHAANGNSPMMMAVESGQPNVLQYFLRLENFFPITTVLADCNNAGTTLLSAAIQGGNIAVINTLIGVVLDQDESIARAYIARQDSQGRSAAHYLFNAAQLIDSINHLIPWSLKDKNGQTPLFAICRSYDHEEYLALVEKSLKAAREAEISTALGAPALDIDAHMDGKMNTLLHIAVDPKITRRLLRDCDSDPNAKNDKQFTPLMVASKFARLDTVRVLFGDERTDLHAREQRGLTAVELAKDDEVRNRIDDMFLLSTRPISQGRITTIVRSFFVEDGTIRMIVKSGAPNPNQTITVTTCRRSLTDFENLATWLALEQPASWIPALSGFRSPFHLPFKPSRIVLHDTQIRLDSFLKTLMSHPSFDTHEMLWEFFLVPDIDPAMLAQRAQAKSSVRLENLREEFAPIPLEVVPEIELFVMHATDQIRLTLDATTLVLRAVNRLRNINADLVDANDLTLFHLDRNGFLPEIQHRALRQHAGALLFNPESSPLTGFHYNLLNTVSSINAILIALSRPTQLISSLRATSDQIEKHEAAAQRARNQRWPSALGLLDDARRRLVEDGVGKAERAREQVDMLGRELSYTQGVVAAELAGFWEARSKKGRDVEAVVSLREGLREFAKSNVIKERERLGRMRRALAGIAREKRRDEMVGEALARVGGGAVASGAPGGGHGFGVDEAVDDTVGKGKGEGEGEGEALATDTLRPAGKAGDKYELQP
ncbi:MAG: hypothetical protein Q9162_004766 [Coniocarpon cinnabarinum]